MLIVLALILVSGWLGDFAGFAGSSSIFHVLLVFASLCVIIHFVAAGSEDELPLSSTPDTPDAPGTPDVPSTKDGAHRNEPSVERGRDAETMA